MSCHCPTLDKLHLCKLVPPVSVSISAIAASAPVAQFTAPCDAFGRIVTNDYSSQGKDCSDIIRKSWAAIDNMAKNGKEISPVISYVGNNYSHFTPTKATTLKWLNDEYRLCKPLKTPSDIRAFKDYLNNLWTNVAMMDYPYPTTFLMPLPGNPVKVNFDTVQSTVPVH